MTTTTSTDLAALRARTAPALEIACLRTSPAWTGVRTSSASSSARRCGRCCITPSSTLHSTQPG